MKTAPLHFKINYLAIERQELINEGNKFGMEIYVLVTQSRAMDGHAQLGWGDKEHETVSLSKRNTVPNGCGAHWWSVVSGMPHFGGDLAPSRDQARS